MLNFSPEQKQIITQMEAHLGLDPKDVSLDESNELFFNVSALSLLRMRLAPDIITFSIHSPEFDSQLQILSSAASLTLADGRGANAVKSAQVGEILHDNVTIKNLTEAENIANSRAARAVLRMIAFEPVKQFQNYLASTATTREIETISQREKDRRFIHKIRDDQDMDETTYRVHLSAASLGKHTSTEGMSDLALSQTAIYFRAILKAAELRRQRAA